MHKLIRCKDHFGKEHEISSEKFIFRASAYGVLIQESKTLFVQERWTNLWEFPGGGVKLFESIPQGLQREFLEETGLLVDLVDLLTFQEDFFYAEDRDEAWHSLRFIYNVRKKSGNLKVHGNQDDIIASQFLSKDQLTIQNTKSAIYSLLNKIY